MQANITILTFYDAKKESLRTIVSLEALKGTCWPWVAWPFWLSKALKHSLRASKDLFISAPSC